MNKNYRMLARYIQSGDCRRALSLLVSENSLDLRYDEGIYFIMSIEGNSTTMSKLCLSILSKINFLSTKLIRKTG